MRRRRAGKKGSGRKGESEPARSLLSLQPTPARDNRPADTLAAAVTWRQSYTGLYSQRQELINQRVKEMSKGGAPREPPPSQGSRRQVGRSI